MRIPVTENPRVPGEGSSARGQSDPKARPKGVVDGQQVNIPVPVCCVMKGRSKSGEPTVERVGRIPREQSQRRKVVDPRIDEFTVTMLTRKASETPAAFRPYRNRHR